MNNVFGLDIGTRNVVGTVGHRTEDGAFIVEAQYVRQHETRSMLDGQIHDIGKVARTISAVKAELEAQLDAPLSEVCIAAAGRVLKTVTTHVEYEYAEESVVTGEDIHTLNLLGESSHNAGVIGNFPILERDVEIHAHEDFLSLGVKVANSKFSHIGLYCLVQ